MKRISILSVALAAFFAVSGCAPSTCEHFEKTAEGLKKKAAGCNAAFQVSGFPACVQSLSDGSCSAADLANIDKQLDCSDKVGQCVAGQEQAWADSVGACSVHLDAVSAACRAAMQKK
ncbi:MAG: hypothetical protein K1X64_09075 [Myxococcaceae bacterium]|nr:hypothetical protein [Myxococcaceae bacterium]